MSTSLKETLQQVNESLQTGGVGRAEVDTLAGSLELEALEKRVIIMEDPFKSGYECKFCNGEGSLKRLDCPKCHAVGSDLATGQVCDVCRGEKFKENVRCPECQGRGTSIEIPEESQRRPTTGTVVSCGPEVRVLNLGDRVLYSNYAGTAIDFRKETKINEQVKKLTLRIMEEHEVYARIHGEATIGDRVR